MQRFSHALALSSALFVATVQAAAQSSTAHAGFRLSDELDVAFGSALASFGDGRYIGFDGVTVALYAPDGTPLTVFGVFDPPVFPSFVELDPTESFACFGESLFGDVFRLDLAAGTFAPLVRLNFNYDLAFDVDPRLAYVSAALGGFGAGNDILRLDLFSGAVVPVAHVDGPSGPVAVSPAGDLYYVTQSSAFPPPPAASDVIVFGDAQLDSGQLLGEADATLFAGGLDGASSLAIDAGSGYVFVAETPFAQEARVLQLAPDGAVRAVVAESVDFIGGLELFPAAGPQILAPFQPAGARLAYVFTNFGGGLTQRVEVEPRRPLADFTGPVSGAAGNATVTIAGAFPGGAVSIMLAPSLAEQAPEVVRELGWGAPVHFAFEPSQLIRRSQNVAVDASGTVSIQYFQGPLLSGEWLFQAILYDDVGHPVGTSMHVIND